MDIDEKSLASGSFVQESRDSRPSPPLVVGVGASAGGLEALESMFDDMPSETGMAFVIVQHLSPDFKSLMDELLARHTDIPIRPVEDGVLIEPNNVYLLPPKKEMIVSGGRLLLTDKDPSAGLPYPIDHFFRSLAQDVGPRAVAVVLSGTGIDGSRGIQDIREHGGMVVVQSLSSAKFDGMPRAAMDSGCAQEILAPEEMPSCLLRRLNQKNGGHEAPLDVNDNGMSTIVRLLHEAHGIDFSHYRPATIHRRTERRLLLNRINDVNEYAERLKTDSAELDRLYKDLLIGVTQFFRDEKAFAEIERVVLPELIRHAGPDELRVWVAGCATGEEAYSLAILIHEQLNKAGRLASARVFATDVHRAALEFAGEGLYSADSLENVSPERLSNYFIEEAGGFRVNQALRQMVVFAPHNIISDAPFTKLDLITCRNLLIYLEPHAQRKTLSLFHFGLRSHGALFLGMSESPSELSGGFDAIDPHWKIYRKRRDAELPPEVRLSRPLAPPRRPVPVPSVPAKPPAHDAQLVSVYDELLSEFMAPGMLVNDRRELVHVFGDAANLLKLQAGRISTDVLELIDSDLQLPLTGALQRASREGGPVTYSNIRLSSQRRERSDDDGEEDDVPIYKITVRPVKLRSQQREFMLVLIDEQKPTADRSQDDVAAAVDFGRVSEERMNDLEAELRHTKQNLQTTIEELETSNEELQAANEELVASNEELQSTNEELHSVNEELFTVNEELFTVNAEYQKKISELTVLTGDMENLLASTDVGTIFLDTDLRIRKFTPRIAELFSLLPQDVGRRIETFGHTIRYEGLHAAMVRVLHTGEPVEAEVQDRDDNWLLMRILPYRVQDEINGIVFTLVDISGLKQAEFEIRDGVRKRDQFLAMLSHELRNPLGALINAAQLLDDDRTSPEIQKQSRTLIRRQADQMSYLLGDLLDLTRITHGKIQISREAVDLRETVDDAVAEVQATIDESRQHLHLEIEESALWVNGSSARLTQIQVNLLNNASKYTPNGGHLWLKLKREKDEAVIIVGDDGAGIESDMLESIFEMFVQSDNTLDRSEGGMGVGLTLTKALVELHDGKIAVESGGRNQGSQFFVRLPLATAPKLELDNPFQNKPEVDVRPLRIGVVEDNADSRVMLESLLELHGHEVQTATDGPEGLALLSSWSPDVALIDIGLPKLNGYEIVKRLKEETESSTRLVALTGYGQSADREAALEAGFDEHLVKPVNLEVLCQVLKRLCSPAYK